MNTKFEFRGLTEAIDKLKALNGSTTKVLAQAMYGWAEEVMAESKDVYVPVDTGALKSSGHVEKPKVSGNTVSVTLGFGGPAGTGKGQTKDVGYSLEVHENLQARHPHGQAKYLETPLLARQDQLAVAIERAVEKAAK